MRHCIKWGKQLQSCWAPCVLSWQALAFRPFFPLKSGDYRTNITCFSHKKHYTQHADRVGPHKHGPQHNLAAQGARADWARLTSFRFGCIRGCRRMPRNAKTAKTRGAAPLWIACAPRRAVQVQHYGSLSCPWPPASLDGWTTPSMRRLTGNSIHQIQT